MEFLGFSAKLTQSLSQPRQKFYLDLLYGTSKSQHIFLSEIARSLNEKTDLTYTIKRLLRNVARDEDLRRIHGNYLDTLRTPIPTVGIKSFHKIERRSNQLSFW